ncbi:MAG: GNAT family N-acetyltransferase [Fluviicola sp.]|nr:MAG: GNAT family N-acetyltransferase [Fluviicola sp.]
MNFKESIELKSARTVLRIVIENDLEFIHSLHSLKETDRYNTLGIPADVSETKKVLDKWLSDYNASPIASYTFIIQDVVSEKPIGVIGLKMGHPKYKRAEVWFKLHKDFWSQGYATEALNILLNFSFNTLVLHRLEAGCAVDNIGSIKVLEKTGFVREGRCRKVLPLESGWSDNYEYAILETDYAVIQA